VDQVDQGGVLHRGGVAGGAGDTGGGTGDVAARLRGAGAGGEVLVGDAAQALADLLGDERLDVDPGVLHELPGHLDQLGAEHVGAELLLAEGQVERRSGGVLRQELPHVGGVVVGGPRDGVAVSVSRRVETVATWA